MRVESVPRGPSSKPGWGNTERTYGCTANDFHLEFFLFTPFATKLLLLLPYNDPLFPSSIPPLFGWKEPPKPDQCNITQDIGYQFYATIGAFYLPLVVMVVIYYRIYQVSYLC